MIQKSLYIFDDKHYLHLYLNLHGKKALIILPNIMTIKEAKRAYDKKRRVI